MSRFPSETQAPEVTQGAGDSDADDSDAELTKAVDFATLISMSSLSAPDVQHDRLTGRKEIAARLAEQAREFGLEVPLDIATTCAGNLDRDFECHVADRLESRGHTFEAELRYRRLQGRPTVANRLGLMLDAKGFHQESWQCYLRAARSNDVVSLFRLATICWTRGNRGWAMRLAKHAVAQLTPDSYHDLVRSIDHLVRQRATDPNPDDHVLVKPSSTASSDTGYALGSVLLTLACRPDLARLAYCSAVARGHSLAAVSLLDLTRGSAIKQPDSWRLNNLLRDGLNDSDFDRYSPVADQRDDFDRSLLLLKNGVQNETFEGLIQSIQAPTARREDAIERVLYTTRFITSLRAYGQFGCDVKALRFIDVAAETVCRKVHRELVTGTVGDAVELINIIRDECAQELENYRQPEPRDPKKVAIPGTIGRMSRGYLDLLPEHREVLILNLAGLYSDEVADVLGYRKIDTDRMFVNAVTRLQEAQQGEQVPTGKILGAEVDSCFSADILKLIEFLPEWSDTETTSQPTLSPDLRKQL